MDYEAIGRRIRFKRKELGIQQERLAEMTNISVTHMSHIETGNTKLSLPVLICIADALSCGTDELLTDNISHCEPIMAKEVSTLLADCTNAQLRFLVDILKAAKASMDRNIR